MEIMKELIIEAKPENVTAVQEFIESHIADCPSSAQSQIGIAVDEIFSNIANYAYSGSDGVGADGVATVRIAAGDDITIEFEDGGVPYDPLAKEDPDTTLTASERDIGGLGIHIVKNIMDSVEYRRDGNKNVLTIKKTLIQ